MEGEGWGSCRFVVLALREELFPVFLFLLWKSKGLNLPAFFVAFKELVLSLFFVEIQGFIILFRLEFIQKVLVLLNYFILVAAILVIIIYLLAVLIFLYLAKFLKFLLQIILLIFIISFFLFTDHFDQNKFLHQEIIKLSLIFMFFVLFCMIPIKKVF